MQRTATYTVRLLALAAVSLGLGNCQSGGGTGGLGGSNTASGGSKTASGGRNTASGGSNTASGGSNTASGGSNTASGGKFGSGGATASGGSVSQGGSVASGGTRDQGGAAGAGGVTATGGAPAVGGTVATGGASANGGVTARGGASAGGTSGSGGVSATGGSTASGAVTMVDAGHVRLLAGSPFYDRQELHRKGYVGSFDADKLLYEYRKLANLPQAGGATGGYGGWDTGFVKGHMLGHFLSAASRMAVATGDATFKTKVTYLVAELAKCQTALAKNGYVAAFSTAPFDWLENGMSGNNEGIAVPYYTIQKTMTGLLDAYHYLGDEQALTVVSKMADYFQTRLAKLSAETIEKMFRTDSRNPGNEYGAMGDVYADLSAVTGQKKYLETAKIFNRSYFMTPLAAGEDKLAGIHSNTHVAQALGIAHTANLSGDTTSLQASENFWKFLTNQHAFTNGGNSFHEWLDKPNVEAGPSIDSGASLPPTTAESCNTNHMLRLTSLLFIRNPRIDYADYYERALYNHILATVAPDTGAVTYFTPMHGHFRTYLDGTFCCNGTGIENTARYNDNIYFEQDNTLWVNLYIPNEVTWDTTGLTIKQEGNAGAGEPVRITVTKGGDATNATLKLRIPFWVSGTPKLTINGVDQDPAPAASTYVTLTREWKVGDVVTLTLPTALRLEHAKDVTSMVSIFFGPILLAGELGAANMPDDFGDKDRDVNLAGATVPTITNSSTNPADWLEAVADKPLAFKAHDAGEASGLVFEPLYAVHHQRYSVYFTQGK